MFRKRRFQQDDWMGGGNNGRRTREQRAFAVTIGVALIAAVVALSFSFSKASFHLPFRAATTTAP